MKQVILALFLKGKTGSGKSSELTSVTQLESHHTGMYAQVWGTHYPMLFLLYRVPLSRVPELAKEDIPPSLFLKYTLLQDLKQQINMHLLKRKMS